MIILARENYFLGTLNLWNSTGQGEFKDPKGTLDD